MIYLLVKRNKIALFFLALSFLFLNLIFKVSNIPRTSLYCQLARASEYPFKFKRSAIISTSVLIILSFGYTVIHFRSTDRNFLGFINKVFRMIHSGYRSLNMNEGRFRTSRTSKEVLFALKNGGEVGGISNDGNTCFMNSVLQSLASSRHLVKFIDSYLYQRIKAPQKDGSIGYIVSNTPKDALVFTFALRKFLEGLNGSYGSKGKEFSAKYLLNKMPNGPKQNFFTGYNQEDAQEFYQLLMSLLEKEYRKVTETSLDESSIDKKAQVELIERDSIRDFKSGCDQLGKLGNVYVPGFQVDPNVENKSKFFPLKLVTPVDGVSAERIGCLTCGEVGGIRFSVTSGLSLNLPAQSSYGSTYKLEDLINEWVSPEVIDDVNCNRCGLIQTKDFLLDKITSSTNDKIKEQFMVRKSEIEEELKKSHITDEIFEKLSIKQMIRKTRKVKEISLARPAPLLAIHINRSIFNPKTYMIVKNPSAVTFPIDLDLTPYVIEPNDIDMDARHAFRKVSKASVDNKEGNFEIEQDQNYKEPLSQETQNLNDRELESNEESDNLIDNILNSRRNSSYEVASRPELVYKLKAAISHFGTHNYGHYICYRKFRGSWWRISDESVYVVTEHEVLNSQGTFMLFYEYNDGYKEILNKLDESELESIETKALQINDNLSPNDGLNENEENNSDIDESSSSESSKLDFSVEDPDFKVSEAKMSDKEQASETNVDINDENDVQYATYINNDALNTYHI